MADFLEGFKDLIAKAILRVDVKDTNALPIQGASIYFYSNTGQDVTSILTAGGAMVTTDLGWWGKVNYTDLVSTGPYTIKVFATGYEPAEIYTANDFVGRGFFSVTLQPVILLLSDVSITPPSAYVTPMKPVVFTLNLTEKAQLSYIKTRVELANGFVTTKRTPIYGKSSVSIDVSNCIRLSVYPTLVESKSTFVEDRNFSEIAYISFYVDNNGKEAQLGDGEVALAFALYTAYFYIEGVNDLTPYALGVRRWIVPVKEPVFRVGYYADVMIWLTEVEDYFIQYDYLDASDNPIEQVVNNLNQSYYVQRIPINPDPPTGAASVVLTVRNSRGDNLSETLKCYYAYED